MTDLSKARAAERDDDGRDRFQVEMTDIGPQYVIPGCERPAAQPDPDMPEVAPQ